MHAVGAGNVIVEIMENSDTTYRVFDWNRRDDQGQPRELHIEQAMRSIDFEDYEPKLVAQAGECLVRHSAFEVEKWNLAAERVVSPEGKFAIVGCLSGEIELRRESLRSLENLSVPAVFRIAAAPCREQLAPARHNPDLAPSSTLWRRPQRDNASFRI